MQTVYYLIDKTKPYQTVFQSHNLEEVFHEYLSQINTLIDFLNNTNISYTIQTLNFEHLQCLEMITTTNKPHPFIVNIYNFNAEQFRLNDKFGNNINLHQYTNLHYIISELKTKLCNQPTRDEMVKSNPLLNTNIQSNPAVLNENKIESKLKVKRSIANKEQLIQKSAIVIRPMESNIIEKPSSNNNITVLDEKEHSVGNIQDIDDIDNLDENIDPEILRKTIESLQEMRNKTQEELENLKKNAETKQETYSNCANHLGDIKRMLVKNKEREEERRKKFYANLDAYYRIKADVETGKFDEDKIPDLFINEYPIYKFMDQNSLLDKEDNYIVFVNIYNQMYQSNDITKEGYVPHNINYLSDDEKQKYENLTQNHDMINDFITQNKTINSTPTETTQDNTELNFENIKFD